MQKQRDQKLAAHQKSSLAPKFQFETVFHKERNGEHFRKRSELQQKVIETQDTSNDKFQTYTVKVSTPETHSSIHKRLKLKDYLHLKDIEKKGSTHSSHIIEHPNQTHQINEKQLSNFGTSKSKQQGHHSHLHEDQKEIENVDLIKEEVNGKIDEQIKKLQDLQKYLKKDFVSKEKKSETLAFLFTIFNKLIDMHKINDEFGDMVLEYRSQVACKQIYIQPKSSGYHWEGDKKNLVSPAKISNQTLQLVRKSQLSSHQK